MNDITKYFIKPEEYNNTNITPIRLLLNDLSKETWIWICIDISETKILEDIKTLMYEIISEINYLSKIDKKITIKLDGLCKYFFKSLEEYSKKIEIHKRLNEIIHKKYYINYTFITNIFKKYIKIHEEQELNLLENIIEDYYKKN